MKDKVRVFGIDIGITSIGWALVEDSKKIIDSGVRIFTQPTNKEGKSLTAIRREHRCRRRVLNRKKQRIKCIKQLIVKNKLLSSKELIILHKQKKQIDVWQLRDEGLKRKLNNKEWARVLLHIAKRRGYSSNRKSVMDSDKKKVSKKKKVLGSIRKNEEKMADCGYKTIGSMIYNEYPQNRVRRNRRQVGYKNFTSRNLLKDEIEYLFKQQREFGNEIASWLLQESYTQEAMSQLPIKWDEKMVGKCKFEKNEYRGAKHSFSVEKSVLLSKINNTDLVNKNTGEIIRLFDHVNLDKLLDIFYCTKEVKYTTLRKKLNIENYEFKQLDYNQDFEYKTYIKTEVTDFYKLEIWLNSKQKAILKNLVLDKSSGKFKKYKYSNIRSILSLSDKQKFNGVEYDQDVLVKKVEDSTFGKLDGYHSIKKALKNETLFNTLFSRLNIFNEIAKILSYKKDDEALKISFYEQVFSQINIDKSIKNEAINHLLDVSFHGFNKLSVKAINNLLPYLENGKRYDEAVKEVYGHHSQFEQSSPQKYLTVLSKEENYQLTNPTVKRAFSQFRKVLNAIISKHESFNVMHIEVAKELKNSKKKRMEILKGQKEFQWEKEALIVKFKEYFGRYPIKDSKEFLKLRLFEQQHGKCIYSTGKIDIERLLEEGYVENDHILPKSRTFDNSLNNRALCLAKENQNKGNQTPFEYLANSDEDSKKWYQFKMYINSIKGIRKAKRNKLLNTTLPKRRGGDLTDDDIENTEYGFLARNLNDTAYAAKFIKNFVENHLEFKHNNKIKQKVKVRTGALTNQLRYNWGLAEKDRKNNLHHAEDAIILAFATQNEVRRISTMSARQEDFKMQTARERGIHFTPPFAHFKESVKESIDKIFVSFAPKRKVSGAAHKETIKKQDGKYKFPVYKNEYGKAIGFAENGEIKRVDVFKNDKGRYQFIPFYPHHFYQNKLPNKNLKGEKFTNDFYFLFSLFKNELIKFKTKKEEKPQLVYFKYIESNGRIAYQQHFKSEIERKKSSKNKKGYTDVLLATGPSLEYLKKYQVSVLGNRQNIVEIKNEKRLSIIKVMRKLKHKNTYKNKK